MVTNVEISVANHLVLPVGILVDEIEALTVSSKRSLLALHASRSTLDRFAVSFNSPPVM